MPSAEKENFVLEPRLVRLEKKKKTRSLFQKQKFYPQCTWMIMMMMLMTMKRR